MSPDKRWRLYVLEYEPCLTEEEYNKIDLSPFEPQTYEEYKKLKEEV